MGCTTLTGMVIPGITRVATTGRLVAGITRNRAEDEDGSRWISFVSVSDIDETHARLIEEGAISVAGPVSVEGRGDLAIYVAPDGAVFGTLNSEVGDPEEMGADIGDFVWIELWSKEPKVAADFYGRLGYQVEKNWASQNENDLLLIAGDYARGGIVEGHPQQKNSGWLLYVRVDDVASAMAKAEDLGGRAINLQGESNALGNIGLLADPTGGVVAVYQYVEPEGGEAGE